MKKTLSVILAVIMIAAVLPFAVAAEKDTVILYTNDVHCAIEDYAVLAAYRADLISQGHNVITVDAGDAIQGEVIGTLTKGEAVVDIMNSVGYDYAVPGNHEFDYGMETILDLAKKEAEYEYLSSNFYSLSSISPVFKPYAIKDLNDFQIAFVGISTPETVSKANPDFFKDESGNFIYGFPTYDMLDGVLYENVQSSVDAAINEGADIVVAVGHLGILETKDGWKSTDVIANTNGIDYFIDAHSHETIESVDYKNKDNETVTLSSTGTKFANFGKLTIDGDGSAEFELVNPDSIVIEELSDDAETAYNSVKTKIDGYNEEMAYLNEVIGESEVNLVAYDTDGTWLVRKQETNTGDFCADAYRAVTGAEIGICNGGGIRNEVAVGDVTRKMLMDINPWSNAMCVIEVTGQQLMDILEHGARLCPESSGGFFQVSGVTFEIHTYRESPVIVDANENFVGIDESMKRRVENVLVGGEPVDLEEKYTVAGTQYVLTSGGDGLTMLEGAKVLQREGLLCDSEMLIRYLELLGGTIPESKYGNPDGDGRITIIDRDPEAGDCDYEIKCGETLEVSVNGPEKIVKFVPRKSALYKLKANSDELDTYCYLYSSTSGEECLASADDSGESTDFVIEYDFEEGETYYFHVGVFSDQEQKFEIYLECGHVFEGESCIICGKVCDHTEIGFLGFCLCGKVFLATDLKEGDEYELERESYDDIFWFRFIPEISGTYSFKSVSENLDPDCNLYDAAGEWINSSYDENGLDFDLISYFEAGETYYFDVRELYGGGAFSVVLEYQTHTADDGSKHAVEFVDSTFSNCTEHGYTSGLYCSICDKFVSGHEELPLDEFYHIDEDINDICDLCGKEIDYYCECICHSENWFLSMIWKIANFFHSVFRVYPECGCGDTHY